MASASKSIMTVPSSSRREVSGDGDDGDVVGLKLAETGGDLAQLQYGQGSVVVNAGREMAQDRCTLVGILRQSS